MVKFIGIEPNGKLFYPTLKNCSHLDGTIFYTTKPKLFGKELLTLFDTPDRNYGLNVIRHLRNFGDGISSRRVTIYAVSERDGDNLSRL